jgi:hypothetical protein
MTILHSLRGIGVALAPWYFFIALTAWVLIFMTGWRLRIARFFRSINRVSTSVDVALTQMFPDEPEDTTDGSAYRKSRHARIESQKGGRHG